FGFGPAVRYDQLDPPTIDAAGLVDAIARHLHAHQCGLAAGSASTGKRLLSANLVGLRLAEGRLPRRRHQHARAERARGRAVSDQPAAGDLAAVPERLTPILRFRLVSHREFLPDWSSMVQTNVVPTAGLGGCDASRPTSSPA